ncbi:MAG: adenylate kinase [Clostridia bacterium]|nr:adenylate kinase [Clostridia bacterium]MBQ9599570.1 adenylate kinase [Clostridia bacterium]
MNLILVGPPGAGKGTQGEILSKRLEIDTISTGVMLRTAIKEQTEVGKLAEKYINDGKLVPDDVIVAIVKERLSQPDCEKGFILDGFPRTVPQAEALTASGVKIDKVLSLEVDDSVIVERLSARRECSKCGAPYSVLYKKPVTEGKCDKCGGELIQRADDNPETIQNRLNVYHEQTEPIKAYYEKAGLLVKAEGADSVDDTTKNVFKALGLE